jgi:RHS repeat-associated protein
MHRPRISTLSGRYSLGHTDSRIVNNDLHQIGDALGSVRQLTVDNGDVILAKSYDPFGTVLSSDGSGNSVFGYANEQLDLTGLVFLRARYYSTTVGKFISRDIWSGDATRPLSMNQWLYGSDNPINRLDPSGLCDNESAAPNLYSIRGCRDSGTTYYLRFAMSQMPWRKFANVSRSPLYGGVQQMLEVPVRKPLNLITSGNCAASTLI